MIQQVFEIFDSQSTRQSEGSGVFWPTVFKLRLLIILVILCGIFQFTPIYAHLIYQRSSILDGSYHLLFTGNFVHLGFSHLVMNLTGLVLIIGLVGENYSEKEWAFIALISSLCVGIGLLMFMPQLQRYVGLSGMIHGVLIAGALLEWRRSGLIGVAVALMTLLKLWYEQSAGPMPGSEQTAGGRVIVDSHLYGAMGGFGAAILVLAARVIRKRLGLQSA